MVLCAVTICGNGFHGRRILVLRVSRPQVIGLIISPSLRRRLLYYLILMNQTQSFGPLLLCLSTTSCAGTSTSVTGGRPSSRAGQGNASRRSAECPPPLVAAGPAQQVLLVRPSRWQHPSSAEEEFIVVDTTGKTLILQKTLGSFSLLRSSFAAVPSPCLQAWY